MYDHNTNNKTIVGGFYDPTILDTIYIYRGIHICISISGFEYSYICRSNWTSKLFLIQLRPQAWMTEYLFYTIYNEHRFISEGYQMSIKAAAEKLSFHFAGFS